MRRLKSSCEQALAEHTEKRILSVLVDSSSIVDEITELSWEIFGCIALVIVPPTLLIPSVELDGFWCLRPSDQLESKHSASVESPSTKILANLAAFLCATNDEGNESPGSCDPGEWDHPSNESEVDLLHSALLDVGKE